MSGFSIFCLVLVWLFLSLASTNGGIARKTGLRGSVFRRTYFNQHYNMYSVLKYIKAVLANIDKRQELRIPFSFKLKFILLAENVSRVCTDFALGSSFYLKGIKNRNIRIQLDFSSANYVFSILNTLMYYDTVFRLVTGQSERTADRDLIIRYAILKHVAIKLGVHPIEWYLSDPIVLAMSSRYEQYVLSKLHHGLAQVLLVEMQTMSKRNQYDGLALALKTVFYTHPEYRKSLVSEDILRIGVLRNQKFVETGLAELFHYPFRWINFTAQEGNNSFKTPYELSEENDRALLFDCDRYLIVPILKKGTMIYSKLSNNLIAYIDLLADKKVDINLWMLDYFSRVKGNYFLFDTYDPSLSFLDRYFDLKRDEWNVETMILHAKFIETMDGLFNGNK